MSSARSPLPALVPGWLRRQGLALLLVCGCGSSAAVGASHRMDVGRDAASPSAGSDAASSDAGRDAASADAGTDAAGSASCDAGPSTGDFPCDVGAVIAARCQPCHQQPQLNGAHFPLLRYEDTREPFGSGGKLRFQRMAQVIEPDFLPHMPPSTAPQPMPPELATLRSWLATCALPVPEGTGCDAREP